VKLFRAPKESLGDLDAEAAATVIAAAADIALVVDGDGVIQDIAIQGPDLALELENADRWLGRPWSEAVREESQPKVGALLQEAAAQRTSRWRQLNHPSSLDAEIPVLYSVVQVGQRNRFVAIGRDLRSIAALQQRVVEAQISIERDYSRLRHLETRYRMLFQSSSEAVLIVDTASQRVVEANPAANKLFAHGTERLVGRPFPDGLGIEDSHALQSLSAMAKTGANVEDLGLRLDGRQEEFLVSATLFRQDVASFLLVRFERVRFDSPTAPPSSAKSKLLRLVETAPDGFVVTDRDGRIVIANAAFLTMAQLSSENQARGESIDRWLGRSSVDLSVLIANLKQHGSIRTFATALRGEYGANTDVEISGVAMADADQQSFGFAIRNVDLRVKTDPLARRELPRSVKQLTELVGRVPLKDIVRETTDVIERLSIEAALELTSDNRASAAEMLGLSRQSLYVKLRRFGLGDLGAEDASER